jgi:type IV fimbrial biogenesis protein FimT
LEAFVMIKKVSGFTMVELITTLAIIALASALSGPSLSKLLSQGRLRGATRQVVSDLMWARMQAVTQKNEFRIFFINDHQYKILDDDNNNGKEEFSEAIRTIDIRAHYDAVCISWTGHPIFFPRGNASMGTITLSNVGGEKKVKVHITGRIKII